MVQKSRTHVLHPLLNSVNQRPQPGIGLALPVVAPHAVVPREQRDGPHEHRQKKSGGQGQSPMEGDHGGCEQQHVG